MTLQIDAILNTTTTICISNLLILVFEVVFLDSGVLLQYKRVLNFVQQVFFLSPMEGSLVNTRAYPALYRGGPPVKRPVLAP